VSFDYTVCVPIILTHPSPPLVYISFIILQAKKCWNFTKKQLSVENALRSTAIPERNHNKISFCRCWLSLVPVWAKEHSPHHRTPTCDIFIYLVIYFTNMRISKCVCIWKHCIRCIRKVNPGTLSLSLSHSQSGGGTPPQSVPGSSRGVAGLL